ncbi:MAG: two-component system response regulator AtoC [Flavobacteriales bacterium]|jgi:two-component system response regulator AtoC
MSNPFKVFIVEDDVWYGEVLEYLLNLNPEYEVERFTTGKEFLANLHRNPNVVTLDYSLEDMSGDQVLLKIKEYSPTLPVIMVSGQNDVSTAVNLLREGVYDYIVKDEEAKDRLWKSVKNIREKLDLEREIDQLREEIGIKYQFNNLIGQSSLINKVKSLMEKACNSNITVSLTGETGTGKEVVAKAIHYNSSRAKQPFVAVNAAAIPSELIESELFGYVKGAFTGADSTRTGKFLQAHKGTLFLDEIGEMNLAIQAKLLRALQEREITPIGSNDLIPFDVRIIVATNQNLGELVQKDTFRNDLYYRLLGLPIELPTLRDRGNDVILLAEFFLAEFAKANTTKKLKLTSSAKSKLREYTFPGNIRELKAVVELAAVMCSNGSIEAADISFNAAIGTSDFLVSENSLKQYTAQIIKHFLNKYDQNVVFVAKKLNIGKSTIYRMIKNKEI